MQMCSCWQAPMHNPRQIFHMHGPTCGLAAKTVHEGNITERYATGNNLLDPLRHVPQHGKLSHPPHGWRVLKPY